MPDDSGKIDPAIPRRVERLIDLLRMLAERGRCARGFGGVLRQREDRKSTRLNSSHSS